MKKISTLAVLMVFAFAMGVNAQIKILYLYGTTGTSTFVMPTTTNDLFLADLQSKTSSYTVTMRACTVSSTSTTYDYSGYDLIVLHESIPGGDAAAGTSSTAATANQYNEAVLLESVDKPILNFKSFFYTTSTTAYKVRWGWGTANAGTGGKGMHVNTGYLNHPIFSGVTLDSNDSVYVFNTYASKNVQPTTIESIGGYEVASVAPNGTSTGTCAIHDVPANVRFGSGTTSASKYLMVALYSGNAGTASAAAPATPSFQYLTSDGITMLENAITYLVSGTQYTPSSSGINSSMANKLHYDGNTIINSDNSILKVYSTSGALVKSANGDISTNSLTKGVYIVRSSDGSLLKIIK